AAAVGPNARSPSCANRSTSPSVSGSSGPTTVRSIACSRAKRVRPFRSSGGTATHVATSALPALPGAHHTSSTCGLRPSLHARACSRPPPPTTRTRMRSVPEVAHAGEHHRDAVRVGGADDLVVARAAAGLDDRRDPGRDALLEAVREGEERVAAERGAGQRDAEAL